MRLFHRKLLRHSKARRRKPSHAFQRQRKNSIAECAVNVMSLHMQTPGKRDLLQTIAVEQRALDRIRKTIAIWRIVDRVASVLQRHVAQDRWIIDNRNG